MASKSKSGGSKTTIGVAKFQPKQKRKRPGRHAKNKRPVKQTFFPSKS